MNPISPRTHITWRRVRSALVLAFLTAASALFTSPAAADGPHVLPAGKHSDDIRLGKLTDLDSYFPFHPSKSPDAWKIRAERVRRQILVATGLWPMPTKDPLKPVIHGRVDRDDYTVERVYFQSFPGLYVTGSLFRPKGKSGKLPAVLCPHGHWANGRFYNQSGSVKQEIAAGAEKFEVGGAYPLQARCVQLARMGCVVFHYDMLGNADSVPFKQDLIHGFARQRPELNSPDRWGLFSAQAELRSQNVMGLQTWNSIRALDFVSELPDVDASRIGVTGASGGGTQTFMLCAIDPRPAVAFPAVMVSTAMQGGCTCENASYLRVGTGNVEFAALFAPRPLAMSSANDWTKELLTKGLPELRQHYAMLGAPQNVTAQYFNFPHNYNQTSRAMMYGWFKQHLKLPADVSAEERDFKPLSIDELTVWSKEHPKPKQDVDAEVALLKGLDADARKQIDATTPHDAKSLAEFRHIVGGGWDIIIGRNLEAAGEVTSDGLTVKNDHDAYLEMGMMLVDKVRSEKIPALFLMPKDWKGDVALWVDGRGKNGMYDGDKPRAEVKSLLDAGVCVAAADLLYQGESVASDAPLTQNRRVENNREFAGYTLGYNQPIFSQRTSDLLGLISFVKHHQRGAKHIHLIATATGAPYAAAAAAQAPDAIARVAIDTGGFRFAKQADIRAIDFVPGAVKYGDLLGLLALGAPHELWLAGEGEQLPPIIASAYSASAAAPSTTTYHGAADQTLAEAAKWLTR